MSRAEMRDSGVEWLGQIPSHWEVRRLKHLAAVRFSNVDKKSRPGESTVRLVNYTEVYYNDYITNELDFMDATAPSAQIDAFKTCADDVIVTKDSEDWQDIAVPTCVAETINRLVCGYHLALIRPIPEMLSGRFIARAFASAPCSYQFKVGANGITRFGLPQSVLINAGFPAPPLHEQRAIAHFLDRETAKLDALIHKSERLITLLREKRQALISHAVTKGLDEHAETRDSGVEWLGQIPSHWDVRRLKNLADIRASNVNKKTVDGEQVVQLLNSREVYYHELIDVHVPLMDATATPEQIRHFALRQGDIVLTKDSVVRGRIAVPAFIVFQKSRVLCDYLLALIRLKDDGALGKFIFLFFASKCSSQYFALEAQGVTIVHLSPTQLGKVPIPLPPLNEQREIASFLDRETAKLDALIHKSERLITLLREKRKALISAAVTGKIDLRSEA